MTTNGSSNGHTNGGRDVLQWRVGLRNSENKYLTAETFGHKINASAAGLKKKQTWVLEHCPANDDKDPETYFYIRSQLNCYLSSDKYGHVTCDKGINEMEGDTRTEQFKVEYNGEGKWAFKNVAYSYYFGGTHDDLKCFAKTPSDSELWTVQLATHPQVNLRNLNRKRYAVLRNDELQCTEIIPWGDDSFIIMHYDESGKYGLKTSDNRFLKSDGTLVKEIEDDAKFALEIRSGGLAFKDSNGYYLTATGSSATLKTKNKKIMKDELFSLEDSHPQVAIQSIDTDKYISTKQGQDLSANQTEIDDQEIFQMEYDKDNRWYLRTCNDMYWSKGSFDGISAKRFNSAAADEFKFKVDYRDDGTVTLAAEEGKYLCNKSTGSVYSKKVDIDENTPKCFFFKLRTVNRPILILKCDYGFVGVKSSSTEVVCMKTSVEVTYLEYQDDGSYALKGSNGKYWTIGDQNSIQANGDSPSCFFRIQFLSQSELCIKAPNGKYLKSSQNTFTAKGEEVDATTRWEY